MNNCAVKASESYKNISNLRKKFCESHTDFHLSLGSKDIESYLKRLTKFKKVSFLSTNGEEKEKDIIFVRGKKMEGRQKGQLELFSKYSQTCLP